MIVCTHGNVSDYCLYSNMIPVCEYVGEIEDYSGICRILVTDKSMSESEYYSLKSTMLARGVELVSVQYNDTDTVAKLIVENIGKNRRPKSGGRNKFGFQEGKLTERGRRIVGRIFELRDRGYSYHRIQSDDGVSHLDGRVLGISTIQIILKNREVYEKEGL